ncbi:MAG: serine hydroxymethyltransferase [Candidatus Komeilibacteria bacterium RIFCSPLOWO2_02_FULL_48_11]|uniref:Serine hydroxymethyltransferase n=1 Tax=Candidatus Komeilibacteria bacterium RIFCSPLOWO2_02_FULL_48_11 TaxID=1798553 RepID=A0A1G2BXC3_9BACT|nr:MAG: serine hydroxymethyltransferase [Candidatus Komeilibacteria bacterium RIFCSPLOWO2_02_FULL_48_11]
MSFLSQFDPEIAEAIENEVKRQREGLEMIASENFVSRAVLEALGTPLTNKYSEGYVGKRYYGGQEYIDVVEQLAIDRAKKLFDAEHVNVQPLSGAPANIAVYSALLEPGDTVLGMHLEHGGHLTHGHPVTFIAKIFNFVRYVTTPEGTIDYDNLRAMALEHKPKLILAGFSAYSRTIDWKKFKAIADEVGALTMADIAHIAGLIAGKQLANPVPIFDVVTTTTHKTLRGPRGGMIFCKDKWAKIIDKAVFPGFQGGPHENIIAAKAVAFREALLPSFQGYARNIIKNAKALERVLKEERFTICFGQTDNHLLLIDLSNKNISGKEAEKALEAAGIYVNKNMVPNDQRKPTDPSGIRLGTPALTTRGFTEAEMEQVGRLISRVIHNHQDNTVLAEIREKTKELAAAHPLYEGWSIQ